MKLISGIALVMIGFGVFGAIAALPISAAFVLILTTLPFLGIYKQKNDLRFKSELTSIHRYVIPLLMVASLKTMIGNLDLLFVKAYFTSYEAGLYAAVSTLGKILLFLPGGMGTVFFPQISARHAENRETKSLLKTGVVYITILVGTATLAYILFPYSVINVVFGPEYLDAQSLLRWYALAVMVGSLNSILLDYNLAKEQMQFIYAFSLLGILQLLLFWLFHATLIQIIQVILVINLLALFFGFVQLIRKEHGHLGAKTV